MSLRERIEYYLETTDDHTYTQSCEIMVMVREMLEEFMNKEFELE